MLQRLGLKEGEAIVHPWVNKALEKAQQKVEARNFDIRKNLLKYDDVMNDQRKVVYEQRNEIMKRRRRLRDGRRHAPRGDRRPGRAPRSRRSAYAEQWDIDGAARRVLRASWRSTCRSPNGRRRRASTTTSIARAHRSRPPTRKMAEKAAQLRRPS